MLTITEQWKKSCDEGEGSVICPECKQEIGQYYADDYTAAELLESGQCPFCDCPGIEEYEYEVRSRCNDCPNKGDCKNADTDSRAISAERSRDRLRYQCTGVLSFAERSHVRNWW